MNTVGSWLFILDFMKEKHMFSKDSWGCVYKYIRLVESRARDKWPIKIEVHIVSGQKWVDKHGRFYLTRLSRRKPLRRGINSLSTYPEWLYSQHSKKVVFNSLTHAMRMLPTILNSLL